jgi:hypothetical protein
VHHAAAADGLLELAGPWMPRLAIGMPALVSSGMAYARGVDTRQRRARALVAALGLLAVGGLACSGSPAELMNSTSGDPPQVPSWVCVPGETQPCPCADDLDGLLTCSPDGSAFGECDCSPGAVSQGPPLTSTGTETGSGTGTDGTQTGPGDTTLDPTSGSTSEPDPTTSGGSSSGPDATTSEGSSTGGSSSSG